MEPDERRTIQKAPASTTARTSDQAARSKPRGCRICRESIGMCAEDHSTVLTRTPQYTRGNIYDDHPSHITHRPTTNYPAPAWRPRVGYKKDDNFSQAYLTAEVRRNLQSLYPYLRATTPKLAVATRRHPYPTNNTGGDGEGGQERVNGDRTATSIRVPRPGKCQRKRQKELQPRVQMQIKTR